MKIAIDGPAGCGKSTVAKEVSKRLNIPYLNTGLVYRATAYVCVKEGIEPDDALRVFEKPFEVKLDVAKTEVFYRGEEITDRLSSEDVGNVASQIATVPAFRERINQYFRALVGDGSVVAEGRDAGTHIFPDAEIKVFLTASEEERARRRYEQLKVQGMEVDFESVLKAIVERDQRDRDRPLYPFRPAEDAVLIDTTGVSVEEVVERVLKLVEERV
ncbi:MAG: (d)CMP kinase [Aquificaceae bacterium]|nr:(d)CMP kinase [Aquificaceae bacterium]